MDPTGETLRLKTLLAPFEAENSASVLIELVNLGEDEYRADLRVKLDSDGYDIFMVEQSWTTSLADQHFVDLLSVDPSGTATAELTTALNAQIPETIELDTYNSKLVAVPFWADFGVFYYRTDFLETLGAQVPRTWTELETTCRAFVSQNPGSPISCFLTGFRNQSGVYAAGEWLFSSSSTPLIGGGLTFNFGDPDFASILTQVRNWTYTGIIKPEAATYSYDDAFDQWSQGNAVFFQGRASHYSKSVASTPIVGKWNVTTLPGKTATMSSSTVSGYHLAISTRSRNQALALRVLRFLNSEAVQVDRGLLFGIPSTWSSYVGSNNATLCGTHIPCSVLRNIRDRRQLTVLPARKVGPLWLDISDSMGRDLQTFFRTPNLTAQDGLLIAGRNVQAIIDRSILSTTSANPSETARVTSTVGVANANVDPPSTNTPVVMIISGIVAGVVFIAIVVALLIIQKRNNRWPFEKPLAPTVPPFVPDADQMAYGNDDPDVMYGVNSPNDVLTSPTSPPLSPATANGKYIWEAASNPRSTAILHSQTSKSYPFSSDYDSVVSPPPRVAALNRSSISNSTTPNYMIPAAAVPVPMVPSGRAGTPSVLNSEVGGFATFGRGTALSVAGSSVRGGGGAGAVVESMGRKHVVVFAFEPTQMDELLLRVGDLVLLKTAYDDGYAFGEIDTPEGPRSGVFPLACLIPSGGALGDSMLPSSPTPPKLTTTSLTSTSTNNHNGTTSPISSGTVIASDSAEALLMTGRITEEAYLRIRNEKKEREERQIKALKERLAGEVSEGERVKLQKRLDELELGI
ncbi:hypothetical protein HDU67_006590 [Dinochytrium kinnereticum]|nr:hypothetical protein HDU67_006590 [Dinochytrium kinnereticum]